VPNILNRFQLRNFRGYPTRRQVPSRLPREIGFHMSAADIGAVEYIADCVAHLAMTAGTAQTANILRWQRFVAPNFPCNLIRVAIEQTATATGNFRFFVANNNDAREGKNAITETFGPFAILYDSGSIDAAGTGIKSTGAISIPLDLGQTYWLGLLSDVSITVRAMNLGNYRGFGYGSGTNSNGNFTAPLTYGALAVGSNPPAATAAGVTTVPAMRYMLGP
jgi:hypothetical protein